ncbi:heavy-metal-associated domain-containing protein [Aureisphaera galaxeae]|uniref:heavy-metal-associated domain-containing protein n=1 Tax=Aureisphaera galaxeae TaxID=1538023 RepID=UPI00234FEAD6|nr:heavy-metal-associated domain-containing protein [Aureisphaera galaxeae]MDC8003762.1 heavy-metal-associated domain-containing protein [Aureisphaera galaxeae]
MKTEVHIQNLKCTGCEQTIMNALRKIEGVDDVSVHVENASVTFKYLSEDLLNEIHAVLSKLGYPVVGDKNPWTKQAKSYVSCAIGKMGAS